MISGLLEAVFAARMGKSRRT